MKITHNNIRQTREHPGSKPKEVYVIDNVSADTSINDVSADEHVNYHEDEPIHDQQLNGLLEDLILLGKVTKIVKIGNIEFELQTLTHKENTLLMQQMLRPKDGVDLFTIRTLALARSLTKINNIPIEYIEIEGNFESILHKKLAILENLQKSVVEKLYNEYDILTKQSSEIFGDEKKGGEQVKK